MSIWENIDCYDETKGELRNFLISVAKFRALDYKRKISKQKINLELKDEIYRDQDNIQIDDEGFYKLIENLKEKDKVIFVKKYLLDESVDKIAKDINMEKDTVYKRLMRGREKIKEYIEN
ncbi:RNA polymerase factor sigma-70 [compost metagenome]